MIREKTKSIVGILSYVLVILSVLVAIIYAFVSASISENMGVIVILGWVFVVILILTSVSAAVLLRSNLLYPIMVCEDAIEQMKQGNLNPNLSMVKEGSELFYLAKQLENYSDNTSKLIQDIEGGLLEMGMGNFKIDAKYKELYVGEYQCIAKAFYSIIDNMTSTLYEIGHATAQVNLGGKQVSSGAQNLANGTTEQSASVEQLLANLRHISDSVKKTAENAKKAAAANETAKVELTNSNKQMSEMVASMYEITEKSNEISKIIKTIDDIAFQTNILSLNAAVEAARAGQAGKGFAIVADEVRNLATKSAEAAQNTAELIEETVNAVQKGAKIANSTAESMTALIESSGGVDQYVREISVATQEQASSIVQINGGVEQISSVVRINTTTAEESATASEELSEQANRLKGLVGKFVLADQNVKKLVVINEKPQNGNSHLLKDERNTKYTNSKY